MINSYNNSMKYEDFIESKRQLTGDFGFEAKYISDNLFDFQKEIVARSVRKGRIGVFADTGLGKTRISLSVAYNIVKHTNKNVLILTPLAVAFQFIDEAKILGIDDIEYSRNGKFNKHIVVCNYEMLKNFNSYDFVACICDESSILKNFKGIIKQQVVAFIRKLPYRFLTTATPSPNDYIELGTSSEALGYMGYMDMLSHFFKSTQNEIDSNKTIGEKYRLLPHAEKSFFEWVNSWSMMIRKPSDIGNFSDDKYKLPELILNTHTVINENDDFQGLFRVEKLKSMWELRVEQKQTEEVRCQKAVELAKDYNCCVYWCNTNNESKLLKTYDKDAVEIIGSQSVEQKEDILINFAKGNIKKLITKASITGMGLNWQHCNHSVFFPTFSYEQYYQAVRRFWRFGQEKNVYIDLILSENQGRVMEVLNEKIEKAKKLYAQLIENRSNSYSDVKKLENCIMTKPAFI